MPITSFQNINLNQVALTVGIGLFVVICIASRQREKSWRISTFFLGGRNIGAPLTAQAYWGSSFSFANGIVYFAVLGYLFGLSVIWFQVPWVIGIWILAWKVPQLIRITDHYTLHGFLGSVYGKWVRLAASAVTIAGFAGLFAYEIVVSTEIMSRVLGFQTGIFIVTLLIGIYVAAHADVGGYSGTARTDRIQNLLGMVAVILLIYFIIAVPDNAINKANLESSKIISSFLDLSAVPWPMWIGILCFAPFVNIVDMSHWQSISANAESTTEEDLSALRWAIIKSGLWMFVFPGAAGAFIGYAWRGIPGITDLTLFSATVSGFPGASGDLAGFVAGFVVLGLLAVSFSSASGYLLASVQTASWDIAHFNQISKFAEKKLTDEDEETIVLQSRLFLYILSISSVLIFVVARYVLGDDRILPLQFALVAMLVSLFPATAYALFLHSRGRGANELCARLTLYSVIAGFVAGLAVYFKSLLLGGDLSEVFQSAPTAALGVSSAVALVAIYKNKKSRVLEDSTKDQIVRGGE